MIRRLMIPGLLGMAVTIAGPALASDLSGTWLRDTGASKVTFSRCGDAVCGSISWLKPGADPKARVGQRVFFDMKPTGPDTWSGSAFNPEDGKTYSGKMTLSGNTLTTAGCVMGVFCKSATWTRTH